MPKTFFISGAILVGLAAAPLTFNGQIKRIFLNGLAIAFLRVFMPFQVASI